MTGILMGQRSKHEDPRCLHKDVEILKVTSKEISLATGKNYSCDFQAIQQKEVGDYSRLLLYHRKSKVKRESENSKDGLVNMKSGVVCFCIFLRRVYKMSAFVK